MTMPSTAPGPAPDMRSAARRPGWSLAAVVVAFAAAMTFGACAARAEIQIFYETENLQDVVPGQDLWRYTYLATGRAFETAYGFQVYFPWESYGTVALIDFPQDAWDVLAFSPDSALGLPGSMTAAARQSLPATPWQFVVDVVWLDITVPRPGSQRYELLDPNFVALDPPGALGTLVVPEPGAGLLMLAGLAVLVARSIPRRVREAFACSR